MSESVSHRTDEATPLLPEEQSTDQKIERTPLPWGQFSIVLILHITEPLTAQVISPFAPQLIRDIGVTGGNESHVGFFVGLLHSLFFLTEALTIFHWSRLSDRVGRKPIILTGLFGLSLSMYCFGLSKTFIQLVLSRALTGALNGNIGIMKTVTAEIMDSTNMPVAYAYIPMTWAGGGGLGPLVGGVLARPAQQFPTVFGSLQFFRDYPYFLACAVPATYTAICWIITFFYLRETMPSPPTISQIVGFRRKGGRVVSSRQSSVDDHHCETPPNSKFTGKPLPLRKLLIPRVLVASCNYAVVSLVDMSFMTMRPVFLSTPVELGGLGMDPPTIGKVLASFGMLNGLFLFFFFTRLHARLGTKNLFTLGILSAIPLVLTMPILNVLARSQGLSATVWVFICLQTVFAILLNLCYGNIFMYIAASSPDRASLGATNGFAQVLVSLVRAVGPAAVNSAFSISVERQLLGGWAVYYLLLAMVIIAITASTFLPKKVWGT